MFYYKQLTLKREHGGVQQHWNILSNYPRVPLSCCWGGTGFLSADHTDACGNRPDVSCGKGIIHRGHAWTGCLREALHSDEVHQGGNWYFAISRLLPQHTAICPGKGGESMLAVAFFMYVSSLI